MVSINYRTNVFGFPVAPDLPIAQNNLGFLDQELALQWVQQNIEAFGGDKEKVTVMVRHLNLFARQRMISTLTLAVVGTICRF